MMFSSGRRTPPASRPRRHGLVLGVAAAALSLLPLAPSAAAAPVKIMPLGDSITVGFPAIPGYRRVLMDKLAAAGIEVDFVGSQKDTDGWAEGQHEAYGGKNPQEIGQLAAASLEAAKPEIVLLMAGTNGITVPPDPEKGPANTAMQLKALVEAITTKLPSTWVIVSSLPSSPQGCWKGMFFFEMFVKRYNALLPAIVEGLAAQGKRVRLVDYYSQIVCEKECEKDGVCTSTDMADNVHPSAAGYAKFADVWAAAVKDVLAGGKGPVVPANYGVGSRPGGALRLDGGPSTARDAASPSPTQRDAAPGGSADAGRAPGPDAAAGGGGLGGGGSAAGGAGGRVNDPTSGGGAGTTGAGGAAVSGGTSGAGGAPGGEPPTLAADGDGGCSCAVGARETRGGVGLGAVVAAAGLLALRRRRRA